jgi:hypothetical protein
MSMMEMKRRRIAVGDYHEAWHTTQVIQTAPTADEPVVLRNKEFLIWGQGIWDCEVGYSYLTGKPVFMDDRGIIATVRNSSTQKGRMDPEVYARRIVACVNYCAGVDTDTLECSSLRETLDSLQSLMLRGRKEELNRGFRVKGDGFNSPS